MNRTCHHNYTNKYLQYDNNILYQCSKCGLITSQKKIRQLNVKNLYKNYYKNEIGVGKFIFWVEYVVKIFRLFRAFKIYTLVPKARTILDLGCGRGFMLYFLKKYFRYQRVTGTQLDIKAASFAKNKLALEIYNKDLLDLNLKHQSFDLITMWHVLEHVPQPEKYLQKIYKLLNKSGTLIIEVPNFKSWSRTFAAKYWLGLDLKYHLYFFTPAVLTQMLRNNYFSIVNIHSFSLEYSVFFSVQSIISRLTKTDNLFFQWLQGAKIKQSIYPHVFLFILFTPISFLINFLLFFSKKGEVLLVVAQKN